MAPQEASPRTAPHSYMHSSELIEAILTTKTRKQLLTNESKRPDEGPLEACQWLLYYYNCHSDLLPCFRNVKSCNAMLLRSAGCHFATRHVSSTHCLTDTGNICGRIHVQVAKIWLQDRPAVAWLKVMNSATYRDLGRLEMAHLLNVGQEPLFELVSITTEHVASCCLLLENAGPD